MNEPREGSAPSFLNEANTMWGSILKAQAGDHSALERVLARYRRPVLREIAQQLRCALPDAEDHAQAFFEVWMRREFLKHVEPDKGRFRAFLKRCVRNYLRDVHDAETAEKRPPPALKDSLDRTDAEGKPVHAPAADPQPIGDRFDVEWAHNLFSNVLEQLQEQYEADRRGPVFHALRGELDGTIEDADLASLARQLGLSVVVIKSYRHRMKKELRRMVEDEVRSSCAEGEDWRDELRHLLDLLSRPLEAKPEPDLN